jgi:hypothetical protein
MRKVPQGCRKPDLKSDWLLFDTPPHLAAAVLTGSVAVLAVVVALYDAVR